jgi:hypothetical protein
MAGSRCVMCNATKTITSISCHLYNRLSCGWNRQYEIRNVGVAVSGMCKVAKKLSILSISVTAERLLTLIYYCIHIILQFEWLKIWFRILSVYE